MSWDGMPLSVVISHIQGREVESVEGGSEKREEDTEMIQPPRIQAFCSKWWYESE